MLFQSNEVEADVGNLPEALGSILNSEVAKRAYEDAGSKAAKEAGNIASDLVKTLHLIAAPFQLLGAYQDRFARFVDRVRGMVPEERQQPAPPQIAGPILENLRFIDEQDSLYKMFTELLARSIDKDRISEAHPAFVHIITQLSRDEAIILADLRIKEYNVVDTMDLDQIHNMFHNRKVLSSDIPTDKMFYPQNIDLYYSHLESLSLVIWPVYKQEPIAIGGRQTGIRRYSKLQPTEFGKLFVKACVPPDGI